MTQDRSRPLRKEKNRQVLPKIRCALALGPGLVLLTGFFVPQLSYSQEDEKVVSEVRLAARGGDFATAFARLDRISKTNLRARAHAVVAREFLVQQKKELAEEQFARAEELAIDGDMRDFDRVGSLAYIALEKARSPGYEQDALRLFKRAVEEAMSLVGYEYDFSLATLALMRKDIDGNVEEAGKLAAKIKIKELRDKVQANLAKIANS